jgi:hypothetical protein
MATTFDDYLHLDLDWHPPESTCRKESQCFLSFLHTLPLPASDLRDFCDFMILCGRKIPAGA